jgi:hypothetical protein
VASGQKKLWFREAKNDNENPASGWDMTIRSILLLAIAAALAGCASMDVANSGQTGGVQTAVYRVADDTTSATEKMPAESKPMRIYWFLGGR